MGESVVTISAVQRPTAAEALSKIVCESVVNSSSLVEFTVVVKSIVTCMTIAHRATPVYLTQPYKDVSIVKSVQY